MNDRRPGFRALTVLAAALAGCGGGAVRTTNPDADGADAPPHGYVLPAFPGGYQFALVLPPSFSPSLALSGEEATREPPESEFYAPGTEYFFSYAFIWWLVGTPDLSTEALQGDVDVYYTGLCPSQTVAVTLQAPDATAGADAGAGVLVARRGGALDVGTCFNHPVPPSAIELSTYDCPDHQAVIALISPQDASGPVWQELRGIRDGFLCW
jgi:hypothetical protein